MTRKTSKFFKGEGSHKAAGKENKRRIHVLKQGDKQARMLGRRLKKCRSGQRCRSTACAKCARKQRREVLRQFKEEFSTQDTNTLVTLIPTQGMSKPEKLSKFNVRRFKNSITQQLNRAGLKQALVFGGIEAVFKEDKGLIFVHAHLIIAGAPDAELKKLRQWYQGNPDGIREMQAKKIKQGDLLKVASYSMKCTTYYREPQYRNLKCPPPDIEAKLLLFMDRHKFRALVFLKGLKFKGEGLVRI